MTYISLSFVTSVSPDFSRPFILQMDASYHGVGAVHSVMSRVLITQLLFSHKLPCEECYSTIEKECLVIELGVKTFKVYLLGKPFYHTDTLEWLDRLKLA